MLVFVDRERRRPRKKGEDEATNGKEWHVGQISSFGLAVVTYN
jgi:hypothetical protein